MARFIEVTETVGLSPGMIQPTWAVRPVTGTQEHPIAVDEVEFTEAKANACLGSVRNPIDLEQGSGSEADNRPHSRSAAS